MPGHSFSKEIFPNVQSKLPLTKLEAVSSHPIASYLVEETNTHLTTTSFQVVVVSNKVSPQPPLLQNKQSQFLQLLIVRRSLDPSPAPLLFSGHAPAPQCASCSEGPKNKHSTPGAALPVPSTRTRSPPYSCWPHFS